MLYPRPTATFDPNRRCKVHDQLNAKVLDWPPAWAPTWQHARNHEHDVVNWTGCSSTAGSRCST